jgi:hypothetical protein
LRQRERPWRARRRCEPNFTQGHDDPRRVPHLSKKQGEAHVAQDEEASLLLMVGGVADSEPVAPPPLVALSQIATEGEVLSGAGVEDGVVGSREVREAVHLVQETVVARLSDAEQECRWWVLDTGAMNHMTGCKSVFSDLDRAIHGTVRFGDGSVVQLKGMGTVLFIGKNREHRAFTGVYYIPRLTTNIISVGQLDEMGYKTLIFDGVMRIRDPEHRLIVKVNRSNNRL